MASKGGKEYMINPATDLAPVCSNCHSMLHTRKSAPYLIDELKEIIKKHKSSTNP